MCIRDRDPHLIQYMDFFLPDMIFHNNNPVQIVCRPMQYHKFHATLKKTARLAGCPEPTIQAMSPHGAKVHVLSASAQLNLDADNRASQGHHRRSSVTLYSRNDVYRALATQRSYNISVRSGWRPIRPQNRGAAPPIPEPSVDIPISVMPNPAAWRDLQPSWQNRMPPIDDRTISGVRGNRFIQVPAFEDTAEHSSHPWAESSTAPPPTDTPPEFSDNEGEQDEDPALDDDEDDAADDAPNDEASPTPSTDLPTDPTSPESINYIINTITGTVHMQDARPQLDPPLPWSTICRTRLRRPIDCYELSNDIPLGLPYCTRRGCPGWRLQQQP